MFVFLPYSSFLFHLKISETQLTQNVSQWVKDQAVSDALHDIFIICGHEVSATPPTPFGTSTSLVSKLGF